MGNMSDYTIEEFREVMRARAEEMVQLLSRKRADYGPSNLVRFGRLGIVIRGGDKLDRLATLIQSNRSVGETGESEEDAWRDWIGYGLLGLQYCLEAQAKERSTSSQGYPSADFANPVVTIEMLADATEDEEVAAILGGINEALEARTSEAVQRAALARAGIHPPVQPGALEEPTWDLAVSQAEVAPQVDLPPGESYYDQGLGSWVRRDSEGNIVFSTPPKTLATDTGPVALHPDADVPALLRPHPIRSETPEYDEDDGPGNHAGPEPPF